LHFFAAKAFDGLTPSGVVSMRTLWVDPVAATASRNNRVIRNSRVIPQPCAISPLNLITTADRTRHLQAHRPRDSTIDNPSPCSPIFATTEFVPQLCDYHDLAPRLQDSSRPAPPLPLRPQVQQGLRRRPWPSQRPGSSCSSCTDVGLSNLLWPRLHPWYLNCLDADSYSNTNRHAHTTHLRGCAAFSFFLGLASTLGHLPAQALRLGTDPCGLLHPTLEQRVAIRFQGPSGACASEFTRPPSQPALQAGSE
jgi:hypothetical protein